MLGTKKLMREKLKWHFLCCHRFILLCRMHSFWCHFCQKKNNNCEGMLEVFQVIIWVTVQSPIYYQLIFMKKTFWHKAMAINVFCSKYTLWNFKNSYTAISWDKQAYSYEKRMWSVPSTCSFLIYQFFLSKVRLIKVTNIFIKKFITDRLTFFYQGINCLSIQLACFLCIFLNICQRKCYIICYIQLQRRKNYRRCYKWIFNIHFQKYIIENRGRVILVTYFFSFNSCIIVQC